MVKGVNRREKCYVETIVDVDTEGVETPLAIYWDDGRCFCIDRVFGQRYAASMKVGGHGLRYEIEVEGKRRFIWHDENGWYVERIVNDGINSM